MHTSATRQSERRSVWSVWPGPAIVRGAWHPGCHGGRSGHPWGYCRVAAGGIGLGHRSGGCVAAGPGQVAPDGRGSGRGGVERVPQLQEGLGRVAPKAPSPAAALAVRCPCCRLTGTFGSLQRHRSARDCDGVTGGRGEGRGSRFREHRRDGPGHVRDWGLGGG